MRWKQSTHARSALCSATTAGTAASHRPADAHAGSDARDPLLGSRHARVRPAAATSPTSTRRWRLRNPLALVVADRADGGRWRGALHRARGADHYALGA